MIAGVSIVAPLLGTVLGNLLIDMPMTPIDYWEPLAVVILGVAAFVFSLLARFRSWARLFGMAQGYAVALVMIVYLVLRSVDSPEFVWLIGGNLVSVMLVGIAALPLKPLQMLAFGLLLSLSHLAALLVGPSFGLWTGSSLVGTMAPLMATFMGTGLTVVIYHQRRSAYWARQQAEQSFEDLQSAQSRLLLSENAASQGRLAAALSHELNSPIGVLNSSLETMVSVYKKQQEQATEEISRLAELFDSTAGAARDSSDRLRAIVDRIQRFTNLDRAEVQTADINELLEDTASLLGSEFDDLAELEWNLGQLTSLRCRPQQISAVFANLLRNAAESIDERPGKIWIRSLQRKGEVVVEIRDNGRGIASERLPGLFEPAFTVSDGRVSTTNWGLFSSRNIVVNHGGDLVIQSSVGEGTTATITLPQSAAA